MKDVIETILMNTIVPFLQFSATPEAALAVAVVFGLAAIALIVNIIKG